MRSNKTEARLDEMQVSIRDRIGNHSFLLLFYLLMLNIGLEGFGIRWLPYPVNVFVIMLACMGHYLVRLVWEGAFAGPRDTNKSLRVIAIAAGSAVVSAMLVLKAQRVFIAPWNNEVSNAGAISLLVMPLAILGITAALHLLSMHRSNRGDE